MFTCLTLNPTSVAHFIFLGKLFFAKRRKLFLFSIPFRIRTLILRVQVFSPSRSHCCERPFKRHPQPRDASVINAGIFSNAFYLARLDKGIMLLPLISYLYLEIYARTFLDQNSNFPITTFIACPGLSRS